MSADMVGLDLRYRGRSGVSGGAVRLAPNLARPLVAFDGGLRDPLSFREGMAALYEVVTGDLRPRWKQDPAREAERRARHSAFLEAREGEEAQIRAEAYAAAEGAGLRAAGLAGSVEGGAGRDEALEGEFRAAHQRYWAARRRWASELAAADPAMFRALVPCDPIVTVAEDAVFFEGFSKDLSAAGCLRVDRDRFSAAQSAAVGTTNVDYSPQLHDQLEGLRSYRAGGLRIDPEGVEASLSGGGLGGNVVREERIALPEGWLAGLGQLAASSMLPAAVFRLDPAAVAKILNWLGRREKEGPRAIRAELAPGRAPVLVLEPWGLRVEGLGVWGGEPRTIRVWGRRRLEALRRALPICEHVEVRLLGTGLPSWWIAKLPGMKFSLGLSGWTANDWSGGAALDLLAGLEPPERRALEAAGAALAALRAGTLEEVAARAGLAGAAAGAALFGLAKGGLALFDEADRRFRWRPILPPEIGAIPLALHPEREAAQEILRAGGLRVVRQEFLGDRRVLVGTLDGAKTFEIHLDEDGVARFGRCDCSWHFRAGIRRGPCRHLLALRLRAG